MEQFAFFPISPGTKRPALEGDWRAHSTFDSAQVDAWEAEGYSLAIDCEKSGLCVVDLDGGPIGEASWAALQEHWGPAPETYEMRTPRGGRHLYFRGEARSTVQQLAPKIDTRSRGGYVLWSGQFEGGEYALARDLPVAGVPKWLPALAEQKVSASKSATSLQDLPDQVAAAIRWLRARAPAIEGQGGNDWTFKTAAWLQNLGISEDKALVLMQAHWNERCDPPWEAEELSVPVHNAYQYAQNEPGAYASPLSTKEAFAVHLEGLKPQNNYRFRLYGETDMDAWQEPRWLVPGWLPEVGLAVLYGLPGSYKTFAAIDLSLFVSTGLAGWGRPASEPRRVVYLAYESPSAIGRERRPAWRILHGPENTEQFKVIKDEMPKAYDAESVAQMVTDILAQGPAPAMIVIDTWARFLSGLDENHAKDAGQAVEAVDFIRKQLNCLVLVVAHSSPKGSGGVRGSTALEGAADTMIEVKREKGTQAIELWCQKQKDAKEPKAPMTFQAIELGGSLVLQPTSQKEHRALVDADDLLEPSKVGAALVRLKAVGKDHMQPTGVLAEELQPHIAEESAEDRLANLGKLEQALKQRCRPGKPLSGYVVWSGGQWLWGILD
jgi:hypothetical protein